MPADEVISLVTPYTGKLTDVLPRRQNLEVSLETSHVPSIQLDDLVCKLTLARCNASA
jgi:hypothetical protein